MRKALKVMSAVLVVAGGSAACANEQPSSPEEELSTEHVTFGEQLGQIRGHHLAALELYRAGDEKGAATHTGHPVEELLAALESDLRERDEDVADDLGPALRAASQVVADEGSPTDLQSAIESAGQVVNRAEAAVAGDFIGTPRYTGSVIAALLHTVNGEYEEAVQDGEVSLLAEYQDGWAFTQIAKAAYQLIEDQVRAADAEDAGKIDDAFETLDDVLPSIKPPDAPTPNEDVEGATSLISSELKEAVEAIVPETTDHPEQAFDNIDDLLTKIEDTFKDDPDGAAELAAEAYLENYELVEAEVIHLASEVNDELEPLLSARTA